MGAERSSVGDRLRDLGIVIPEAPVPLAAYRPALARDGLVFTSGQLPLIDGIAVATGLVGGPDVTEETGRECARVSTVNALAAVQEAIGSLDRVVSVVKVTVFVASAAGFFNYPQVANGASVLLGEVFGENGTHARSAVGVAGLPLNCPVEVELVAAYE
jgi:enamine deaminase RidA (YjgF/YER057c/UK114 family)